MKALLRSFNSRADNY